VLFDFASMLWCHGDVVTSVLMITQSSSSQCVVTSTMVRIAVVHRSCKASI
jgi:hypothetical protein